MTITARGESPVVRSLTAALDPARHRYLYTATGAAIAGGLTYWVTAALPYYPVAWRILLLAAVVVAWVWRPNIGRTVTAAALVLPVAYWLGFGLNGLYVTGLVALGTLLLDPYSFLVMVVTLAALFIPPLAVLAAAAPLALAILEPRRAALVAGVTCLAGLVALMVVGRTGAGDVLIVPVNASVLTATLAPVTSLLDFGWLSGPSHDSAFVAFLADLGRPFADVPVLVGQIALWAGAAAVASALVFHAPWDRVVGRRASFEFWPMRTVPAVACGALVIAVGSPLVSALLTGGPTAVSLALSPIAAGALVVLVMPVLSRLPEGLGGWSQFFAPVTEPSVRTRARRTRTGTGLDDEVESAPAALGIEVPRDSWDELAGVEGIRAEIEEAVASQFDPKVRDSYRAMSLRPTRGILLFGPPGTGKTKIARVIAAQAQVTFLAVSGSEFESKWHGESESNLRRIFDEAQRGAPSILFFDELEAFLPKRSELSRSDAPEKRVVSTFLGLADGAVALEGVLLVGATNYPNLIDEAALRPGRFDKLIYVSAPDRPARRLIFERYLAKRPLAADVDIDELASRTERYTGADIEAVCMEAARRALRRAGTGTKTLEPIAMADLTAAIGGAKASVTFDQVRAFEAIADRYGRRAEKPPDINVVERRKLGWDDVAGLAGIKEALREAIELPLERPGLFKEYGISPPRGVMLFGPPGCGKTFLAKVVASSAGAHFLQVRGPELLEARVGGSESQLRNLFNRARENAPCVLFFDEIDAIAGSRGSMDSGRTQILTQLLVEMDGVDELQGVVVVAATNRPDALDAALLRPGRFDRVLYVPPPDHAARVALFELGLAGKPVAPDLDLDRLAAVTEGYSGADITAICGSAAIVTAKQALAVGEKQAVTTERLLAQVEKTSSSLTAAQLAQYEALRDELER